MGVSSGRNYESSRSNNFGKTSSELFNGMDVFEVDENGFQNIQHSDQNLRSYMEMPPEYVSKKGMTRYNSALKHLFPFRREREQKKKVLGIDEAGFFSLITFSWMSDFIYKAYKKSLTIDDIPLCSPLDSCDLNSQRLESLWQKELIVKGPSKASFGVAVWKFVRTRIFVGCLTFSISCLMGFLSPLAEELAIEYEEERSLDKHRATLVITISTREWETCQMRHAKITICMRKLLECLENPNETDINRYIWAIALTSVEILRTMFFALYYSISYRTASRLRSACLSLVYKKVIRLNSSRSISTGKIINLYSFDGPRLYYMIIFGPMAIGGPILSICGFCYIYYILGSWALLGMIIFVSYYPLQYLLSHLTGYYRGKVVLNTDKRIKIMTEILTSIKLIKMYAWENWFSNQINEVRKKELAEEEKISYFQSIGISLAPTIPVISGIATFLIHVVTGGNLGASQAFSVFVFLSKQMKTSIQVIRDGSLSFYEGLISVQRFKAYTILVLLLTHLRTALLNIRWGSENFIQGRIVCNRFQNVLMLEENITCMHQESDENLALCIKDGCFVWDFPVSEPSVKEKNPKENDKLLEGKNECPEVLHSINISVPKRALIGVCGPVGAGKSSLLLACLGQLKMVSGQISRSGNCAYVSQESWMENASLKDNILFGERFDPVKYINVLRSCALNKDINFLAGGDETEIGERGVNLSGGQKQRVSLARALYSDRDIYFLDDPFSAVDPQVAVQIFEKYVLKDLAKKTVILVTRQVQCLQKCDEIIVMKEGRIVEKGTYVSLLSEGKEFRLLIESESFQKYHKDLSDQKNVGKFEIVQNEEKLEDLKSFSPKKLTQAEEQIQGTVKTYAYRAYMAACGGYFVCFLVILIIFLNVGCNVFSSWWLAMWIKAGSGNTTVIDSITNQTIISSNIKDNPELPFYMEVYASIIGLILATCIIRGLVYTKVTIRASEVLHRNLFEKILKSPLSYFERTPIGQIQNLVSRDINEVDSRLPEAVESMLQNIWSVMFSFLSITLVFHWFIVPLIFFGCLYYFISKIFRVAIRDLKRIENITRAPVFSSISATVQGLPIIHAFNKEKNYVNQFCKIFDENATAIYLSSNAMRWMAVRLDSISVIITFITSLLVALLKKEIAPAFAGLALSYAAQICGVFQYTIRLMSENEARFISVERIQNIIEKLQPEGDLEEEVKVLQNWPSHGEIQFHKVTLSYGQDFPSVLKDISFSIKGEEKIGVIGRTGAGKSSLVAALFRLVELTSGEILIDGVNIAKVPLSALRGHLSVIPQDPVIFNDSLRSNLDPFRQYDDSKLWEVLRKTKLATKVKSLPNLLETCVGEGEGLSVGEKQLLCLARTLLRNSKILVLDEATASIDPETERAVQTAIQEEFKKCTVITIAHRLSFVTNYDKILVIDQGTILEFDDPKLLMNHPNSRFAKMLAASEMLLFS